LQVKEKIMAQPIPFESPKRDFREELRVRLEQAPAGHAEAILASYEVLQGLHDTGTLELLRGVLGGSDKILESWSRRQRPLRLFEVFATLSLG
jgi:hypothetical protein